MTPDQLARVAALEHQLQHLRRIRTRVLTADRVTPGRSTFWKGTARDKYEEMVRRLDAALTETDAALSDATAATARALGAANHGG